MPARARSLVVASFNLHAGVDGWGRPFDVVAACAATEADVLVLQEDWVPDGGPGVGARVAEALGMALVEHPLASGRLAGPHPEADDRWMPRAGWGATSNALYLDGARPLSDRVAATSRYATAQPGTWGLAVLSRRPVSGHQVIELGRLRLDRAPRAALVVDLDVDGRPLVVVGTHMSHLQFGSPRHFWRLARALPPLLGARPGVLCGDMNLWGPPVGLFFGGWHRPVRGRTWPAWRPHSQLDHLLVRGPVTAAGGQVLPYLGSDHRAVRATVTLAG